MNQEDLKNLKIEDLEEVTDGYWPEGEEMIIQNASFIKTESYGLSIEKVFAIISGVDFPVLTKTDNDNLLHGNKKAYKIPKPKIREMNRFEVMEYLHLLQLELSSITIPFFEKPKDMNYDLLMFGKVVVLIHEKPHDISYYSPSNEKCYFGFAILKNGKITEFKLPQIEV